MKIIGLTGPSGSGKSSCYDFFNKLDIPCIDADDIYHKLLIPPSECVNELVSEFTSEILIDGKVDRKRLSQIVFFDKTGERLKKLNEITHKFVIKEINKKLDEIKLQNKKASVIDAPLLFESGLHNQCDLTIAIVADEKTRIDRIVSRDSLEFDMAKARTDAQKPLDFYESKATYTITNDSTIEALNNKLYKALNKENLI